MRGLIDGCTIAISKKTRARLIKLEGEYLSYDEIISYLLDKNDLSELGKND